MIIHLLSLRKNFLTPTLFSTFSSRHNTLTIFQALGSERKRRFHALHGFYTATCRTDRSR